MEDFPVNSLLSQRMYSALSALLLMGSGCNIYDFLDSPSGDDQLLSAARACFNDGDLACAREQYAKLSTNSAAVRESELAFITLEENGAGMATFADAFGGGFGGAGINRLARKMYTSDSATLATRRSNITTVFNNATTTNIPDVKLAALVRFASATAVLGIVFAQQSGNGILTRAEVVASATTCNSGNCAGGGCAEGGGGISDTTGGTTMATSAPNIDLIDNLINGKIVPALNLLGAAGDFSTTSGLMSLALSGGLYGCYRQQLLNFGVGE